MLGAQVIPISCETKSFITLDQMKRAFVPDNDDHFAPTRLICLENTLHGQIYPLEEIRKIRQFCLSENIQMHLDGARLWNASVATGISLAEYCENFDSISICFSKGMGAPIGSVLLGTKPFIKKARHFRKLFGGGWRQAGNLAAACLYSLDFILPELKKDHLRAKELARGFEKMGFEITHAVDTNMVWVDLSSQGLDATQVKEALKAQGIHVFESQEMRFVIHHHITDEAIQKVLTLFSLMIQKEL